MFFQYVCLLTDEKLAKIDFNRILSPFQPNKVYNNIVVQTCLKHLPVAFMKSPLGASFLQLLMAVESPLVAEATGCTSMVVHTQSFSKLAPPAVWALETSYQSPLYRSFRKPAATGGALQELLPTMNARLISSRNIYNKVNNVSFSDNFYFYFIHASKGN